MWVHSAMSRVGVSSVKPSTLFGRHGDVYKKGDQVYIAPDAYYVPVEPINPIAPASFANTVIPAGRLLDGKAIVQQAKLHPILGTVIDSSRLVALVKTGEFHFNQVLQNRLFSKKEVEEAIAKDKEQGKQKLADASASGESFQHNSRSWLTELWKA